MNELSEGKGESVSPPSVTFTVFTPTYNRAHTLNRVYLSLQRQTFRDFEWLIIDDGSTDNTSDLIKSWKNEAEFPIRYLWQENQGKPTAFNRGVEEAQGKYFLVIDSDDGFISEALEQFIYYWECIPQNRQQMFIGVSALCMDQTGQVIGDRFPSEPFDSDSLEIRYKYKIKGEKWGFLRTEVIKHFSFPVLEKSKFIPEGVLWGRIAQKYKTRFVNKPLRIYWNEDNPGSNQLSKFSSPVAYAEGYALWHRLRLNHEISWFLHDPKEFFRSAIHYARFSLHNHVGVGRQLRLLENRLAKCLWFLMLPLAVLVFLKDSK